MHLVGFYYKNYDARSPERLFAHQHGVAGTHIPEETPAYLVRRWRQVSSEIWALKYKELICISSHHIHHKSPKFHLHLLFLFSVTCDIRYILTGPRTTVYKTVQQEAFYRKR